jgi:hypothetical protein
MSEGSGEQPELHPDAPTVPGEPDEFGLRTAWQSEAIRIEAAEFLVATRAQQEGRLRIARDLDTLRVLQRPDS